MRYPNLGLSFLALVIATTSTQITFSLSASPGELPVLAQTPDPRKTQADSLLDQGIQQYQTSQWKAAMQSWQQALSIYREIQDRQGEGRALGNLGNAYRYLGDYPKAIDYHQQSLALAREIKNRQSEGKALGNLGNAYRSLGNYKKAIDYYQQVLALARSIQDRQSEGKALGNLGNAYGYLGDYPKAIDYLQQSLALARSIQDRQDEGKALGNLGNAYGYLGDYPKAIDYLQQSLAIARKIKNRQDEGKALGNLGNAYGYLGDYPKAIDYHQQSLAIARSIQDRQSEGNALNNLGFAYYKQGNLTLAESTLIASMKAKESLRSRDLKDGEKVSIFETQRSTYHTLQKVLIAQNKTDAALEISERGRGRAFVELLAARLSANPKKQFPTPPNIAEIKQIAKSQNATVVEYSIIYDEFKIQGKQETKESELYIWVIKPTGEITFRKADLKPLWQKENTTLAQLVTNSRESIGVRGRGIFESSYKPNPSLAKQRFQRLHQLLINPIADLLPKNPDERVTFIPQSSLFLVPFAALQDEQGKYLIEKHTILTAPAIQVLDLTSKQRQKVSGNQALVLGNPIMPSVPPKIGETPQQLTPLPGAEKEAKEIAQLLNTKAITGKEATKAALIQKLPQARFIHLATHGLLDDFKGLGVPGAVALAPDGKDNGLLTANEILDLKINAELVVLSACDTGQGKLTGDGVIGLSRALISAGAPSVIVTLWSIPDSPSALLMGEFYRQLQKNPDKAWALRQAMLVTMKQHPNPSAWAAFTLIGEAK
ncbi:MULTISPECIES: CHAT domain-containing protein [Calothrix]|uniref:CHAT domain-containing protein n=2 Tax=Calothrix TaxID=1186 RepID=A0ABR8AAC4_9CYAN|nr:MULTISPECIES: CHAT domain-containing tetratricopeptide repeat protein [Calothrix]MBD2196891.1 CHAT domain-containing protein [Calothrix parietina FACHB-288]MBD2225439.1 CHAT domain-containing protein [Calothrix anomala FACHB-343]